MVCPFGDNASATADWKVAKKLSGSRGVDTYMACRQCGCGCVAADGIVG